MSCDELLDQLPDFTLGTLSDEERAGVRRHLRGCASCRAEAATLDEGVAMFASAAHAVEPPPELRGRILGTLAEEWQDQPVKSLRRRGWVVRTLAVAAAVATVAGAVTWASVSQIRASHAAEDAASYRNFLQALGGKDVRVGTLHSIGTNELDGSVVLYDSERGQSWAIVLLRAPGLTGEVDVTIMSTSGRKIDLRPIEIDGDGEGATWLVTSANIENYWTVRLTAPDGSLVATGTVAEH
jgi:predicted anti-sigma-YlaC factor YlaD